MTSEILYLESCLAIEKSMVEIDEAFTEAAQSIDEGFLFESSKDVFETIKQKILNFVEKIKRIFKGKASKDQNERIDKAGKANKGAKIQCADGGKVVTLFNKAKAMIAKGKDSEEVRRWFKRGCAALGVVAVSGATYAGVKHHKGKTINAESAASEAIKVDNTAVKEGDNTKKQAFAFLANFKKNSTKGIHTNDGEKAKGLLKLGADFSTAMCGVKRSIISGLSNAKGKVAANKTKKKTMSKAAEVFTGTNESCDDLFIDDDLMLADEAADDYSDILDDLEEEFEL